MAGEGTDEARERDIAAVRREESSRRARVPHQAVAQARRRLIWKLLDYSEPEFLAALTRFGLRPGSEAYRKALSAFRDARR
ncbi:MAG: hypothetical protein ACRD1Y_10725 [Terriglobales bacterium]